MTTEIKEQKLKEFEDQLNAQKEYYTKLVKEIELVASNIKTLDGAMQGFKIAVQIDNPTFGQVREAEISDAHNAQTVTDIVETK